MMALSLVLSCERDQEAGSGTAPKLEPVHISTGFVATLPGAGTKTAVDMTTGLITWMTDDPILVSNGSESMTMYVEEGGSTYAALYAEEEVFEGSHFYAVYPEENAQYASGVFQSFIPSAQTYVRGGFATQTFPMVAICDAQRHFAFRNAASLIAVRVRSSFVDGLSIGSVTLTANEALSGPIQVNYTEGTEPFVDCGYGEKRVTVTCPGQGAPMGEPIYVVVAPGDYSGLHAVVTLSNGLSYSYDIDGVLSVNRSAYQTLDLTLEDRYTDLSAEETANCYALTQSGSYKFRANVKGNGVTTSCGLPAETPGIAGLKVYYSDGAAFIDGGFALIDDYIYFKTVDGVLPSGTVLLSALDENGETLWSWHIWANAELADVALSDGTVWLNMNLGAHQIGFNGEGYNGYYYQWGRKDPFLQKFTTKTTTTELAPFVSHASATDGSLENSIANPHIFYGGYHPSGVTDITEDWSTYEDDVKVYDWWNKNITGDGQVKVEACKTMFDPCPVGYHVPVYADLAALLNLAKANVVSSEGGRTVDGKLFFPYTSYRYVAIYADWWPGGKEASRIFLPSATPYETTTKSHRRISRLYMTSSPSQGMTNGARSYGLAVRCIKDGYSAPTDDGETSFGSDIEDMTPDNWE